MVVGNALREMVFGFKKCLGCLGGVEHPAPDTPSTTHIAALQQGMQFQHKNISCRDFWKFKNHFLAVLPPRCFHSTHYHTI